MCQAGIRLCKCRRNGCKYHHDSAVFPKEKQTWTSFNSSSKLPELALKVYEGSMDLPRLRRPVWRKVSVNLVELNAKILFGSTNLFFDFSPGSGCQPVSLGTGGPASPPNKFTLSKQCLGTVPPACVGPVCHGRCPATVAGLQVPTGTGGPVAPPYKFTLSKQCLGTVPPAWVGRVCHQCRPLKKARGSRCRSTVAHQLNFPRKPSSAAGRGARVAVVPTERRASSQLP